MKIAITGGTLEHLRDALDAMVDGNDAAGAVAGGDWRWLVIGAELDATVPYDLPKVTMVSSDRNDHARWDARYGRWERLHICDTCGREDWSEHAVWACGCEPDHVEQAKMELEQARAELKRVVQKIHERECAYDNYYSGGYAANDRLWLAEAEERVRKAEEGRT